MENTPQETTVEHDEQVDAEEAEAEAAFAAGAQKVLKNEPASSTEQSTTTADAAAAQAAADKPGVKKDDATAAAAAQAAPAAAAAPAEDPWKDVPKVVRERLEQLASVPGAIDKLNGHIGGMKRDLTAAVATAKAAATQKAGEGAAPSDKQVHAAMADPKAWDKLKEDFPDWAAPMERELSAIRADVAKKSDVDVAAIGKQVVDSITPNLDDRDRRTRAFARIDLSHEGWEETVKTPDFGDWLQKQPSDVQALSKSPKALDAVKLLDTYKEHQATAKAAPQTRDKKNARLEAAVTPRGSTVQSTAGALTEEQAFEAGVKKVLKNKA